MIASQAVITGAFSLAEQAIQLGLLPRMEIVHTSETQAGQIFLPQINLHAADRRSLLVLCSAPPTPSPTPMAWR